MPRRINPQIFGNDFVESLREAYDTIGGHHYLVEKSQTHPKEFMQLLARVIPQQVNANIQTEIVDVAEAMKAANERLRLEQMDAIDLVPTDDQPTDDQPTDDQPTDGQTTDGQTTDGQTARIEKPQTETFSRTRRRQISRPLVPKSTSPTHTGQT